MDELQNILSRDYDNKLLSESLMSVKLLFNTKNYPALTSRLNKCLLSLQRQKYSSRLA